jgi:DNA polymerase
MLTTTGPDGLTYTWRDDRSEFERIGDYCKQDVATECAIDEMLLQHTPRERRVWELDQIINDRGVKLNLPLVRSAVEVVEVAKTELHARMAEITDGAVPKCSQVKKLSDWINSRGITCTSIASGAQEELFLAAEILNDDAVIEAIELRQQSGKGSPTSKFQTMLDCACEDHKARGQLNYAGATTTGRWSGRLIQFQNLPAIDEDLDGPMVDCVLRILAAPHLSVQERYEAIRIVCGMALPVLAKCPRKMLMASTGCRFIGGDYSNIEGCTSAWVADETWKVEAYLEFQRTGDKNKDLYRVAFSRAFGAALASITKAQRQVGKVLELACGFGGSIGALVRMMAKYKMKPAQMVGPVRESVSEAVWQAACDRMKRPGTQTFGLTEDEWVAIRIAVDGWRAAHPNLQAAWYEVGDAIVAAVADPGRVVACLGSRVSYVYARQVLWCRLPSGRMLAYHRPRLRQRVDVQIEDAEGRRAWVPEPEVQYWLKSGCVQTDSEPRVRRTVSYEGYDGTTKRWTSFELGGPLGYQNIVQAIARDVMVEGMFSAEAHGYPIVLTVHDEILCDVPKNHGSAKQLQDLMAKPSDWCKGLPLKAACWEGESYDK